MKKLLKSSLAALIGFTATFNFVISSSLAIELDDASRTVALNSSKSVTHHLNKLNVENVYS